MVSQHTVGHVYSISILGPDLPQVRPGTCALCRGEGSGQRVQLLNVAPWQNYREGPQKPSPPYHPQPQRRIFLLERGEPSGGTELWALHGATAHISMAKSSPDQMEENPIYPIIKSPRERKRERVQGNHLFCRFAQGLQPGITCPAKKPFKSCPTGDGPRFPLLGWFYPYPRERYTAVTTHCLHGTNLLPWAQSLQPGFQHMAGRKTRTQGLCLASGLNTEKRFSNSSSRAWHLIPQR